jgi:hypothetical protein
LLFLSADGRRIIKMASAYSREGGWNNHRSIADLRSAPKASVFDVSEIGAS